MPVGLGALRVRLDVAAILEELVDDIAFRGAHRVEGHRAAAAHRVGRGLVRLAVERLPRSRLYGPYHHGDRHYFQWMVRGRALAEDLMPILDRHLTPELDGHASARVAAMRERYADRL